MSFQHSAVTVALVCAGFAGGWWLRGAVPTEPDFAPVIASERPVAPTANTPSPAPITRSSTEPTPPAKAEPSVVSEPESADAADDAQPDAMRQFQQLLAEEAFAAAMDLYRDIERQDAEKALRLKQSVMDHLHRYLRDDNGIALTGLVEAFLSYDYRDLDVLLVLARYHLQSGYPGEAARTFQLAFTYAYGAEELQRVESAFRTFVDEVHETLESTQERVAFYESLGLLDLTRPEYRLRLARLYLEQGQLVWGRELLEELLSEPTVATQARELLEESRSGTAKVARQPTAAPAGADTVAVTAHGSHYHLPLTVNGRQDVQLLIDTGASTTTLSQASFERISRYGGVTRVGPQIFNTANGPAKGVVYQMETVQVGQQRLRNVQVAVLDLNMPEGIDGLLGMNILGNFRFELDQDGHQMRLRPRQ